MKKLDIPTITCAPETLFDAIKLNEKERLDANEFDFSQTFDCKSCSRSFTPKKSQWIFHKLCDECFDEFDKQKMAMRFSNCFGDGSIPGTNFAEEWIRSKK